MAPSTEEIIVRLRALLVESDLQTTTEKMLRKKLEEEFGVDLTDKKAVLRKEIEQYLAEQGGADDEEDAEDEESGRRVRGSSLGCWLSEPLQAFLGEESLPRTQVVKRLWEYIKANDLQDPRDKRKILLDAKLKTLFNPPLTMFTMNTQLSRHVKTLDTDDARPAAKSSAGAKRDAPKDKDKDKDKQPAKKKVKGDKGAAEGGEGAEKKKASGFNKPCKLDSVLSSWTGQESMGRADLTSFFWSYVKERNLQDPADKKFVLCDDKLKAVTGEDRIHGFSIQKYLGSHILKD